MKYKIIMLPSARNSLLEIRTYLSQFYPNTAMKKCNRILDRIASLADMPFMCEVYPSTVGEFQYRKMVADEYLIFYTVIDNTVEIHLIINGKFDIAKYLGG